ncbi:MAG: ECF transporter S component [Oscillospiraceae bacterium]|nr:ECF transporter S component [Oscillospiraceae bacterium]
MKQQDKLSHMVYAGLFAALTALLTAGLHIPVGNGYIHCGDAVILLAAVMLPMPYAIGAGAVGGMLADLIAGYPAYALPSMIIKGLLAFTFAMIGGEKHLCFRRVTGLIACGLVSVIGYWVTGVFLYGGWIAQAIDTIPGNVIQAIASSCVYVAASAAIARQNRMQVL